MRFCFDVLDEERVLGSNTIDEADNAAARQAVLLALYIFSADHPDIRSRLSIRLCDSAGELLDIVRLPDRLAGKQRPASHRSSSSAQILALSGRCHF